MGPKGLPVAEAAVYVVSAPVAMPDVAQLTDDQGRFTIAAPAPGLYTIGARSDTLGSARADVLVGGQETVTIEVRYEPQS